MSVREEYTPDTGAVRAAYTRAMRQAFIASTSEHIEEFDRWLAAHDRALREQTAQKIEVEMRRHDNAQIGFSAVGDAYAHAARIARGEGDAHRPERCPTCGCELAYPTAVHVVDCGEGSE